MDCFSPTLFFQFIITIPFISPVKIRSMLVNPGRGDFAPQVRCRKAHHIPILAHSHPFPLPPPGQRIRAYVNRPNGIDFADVEASSSPSSTVPMGGAGRGSGVGPVSSGKPQADFLLQEETNGVTEYPVSISRFQNVNSVTLVVVSRSSQGRAFSIFLTHTRLQSDAPSQSLSRLYYLGFRGTSLNMKKEEEPDFQVGAANSADKPVDGVRDSRRNFGGIGASYEGAR